MIYLYIYKLNKLKKKKTFIVLIYLTLKQEEKYFKNYILFCFVLFLEFNFMRTG